LYKSLRLFYDERAYPEAHSTGSGPLGSVEPSVLFQTGGDPKSVGWRHLFLNNSVLIRMPRDCTESNSTGCTVPRVTEASKNK